MLPTPPKRRLLPQQTQRSQQPTLIPDIFPARRSRELTTPLPMRLLWALAQEQSALKPTPTDCLLTRKPVPAAITRPCSRVATLVSAQQIQQLCYTYSKRPRAG